jgi:hypothetical protein
MAMIYALGIALVSLLLLPSQTQAQVQPVTFKYALSNAMYLSNAAYVLPTQAGAGAITLDIWQSRGLSVQGLFVGTSLSTTGAVGLGFSVSVDGTNFPSTNQLFWAMLSPCGATYTSSYTNFAPVYLDNARSIKLVSVTNNIAATNLCNWLSNVIIGIKN